MARIYVPGSAARSAAALFGTWRGRVGQPDQLPQPEHQQQTGRSPHRDGRTFGLGADPSNDPHGARMNGTLDDDPGRASRINPRFACRVLGPASGGGRSALAGHTPQGLRAARRNRGGCGEAADPALSVTASRNGTKIDQRQTGTAAVLRGTPTPTPRSSPRWSRSAQSMRQVLARDMLRPRARSHVTFHPCLAWRQIPSAARVGLLRRPVTFRPWAF